MRKAIPTRELDRFRKNRRELARRLGDRRNVLGSMVGLKLRQGESQGRPSYTLLVSSKVPPEELPPRERIPRRATIGGMVLETDVIELSDLVLQEGDFPTEGALTTFDGVENGTLSALASTSNGLYGVSCAHVMRGRDRDPFTPAEIGIWSPTLKRRVPVGASAFAITGAGLGIPGDFGFVDAGIFTLEDDDLRRRAAAAPPLRTAQARLGELVTGAATSGLKTGRVLGVDVDFDGVLADVMVQVDAPGTFRGDSGTTWVNGAGAAVALHAMGNGAGPGQPSDLSAGMSALRAARGLGVRLLSP